MLHCTISHSCIIWTTMEHPFLSGYESTFLTLFSKTRIWLLFVLVHRLLGWVYFCFVVKHSAGWTFSRISGCWHPRNLPENRSRTVERFVSLLRCFCAPPNAEPILQAANIAGTNYENNVVYSVVLSGNCISLLFEFEKRSLSPNNSWTGSLVKMFFPLLFSFVSYFWSIPGFCIIMLFEFMSCLQLA